VSDFIKLLTFFLFLAAAHRVSDFIVLYSVSLVCEIPEGWACHVRGGGELSLPCFIQVLQSIFLFGFLCSHIMPVQMSRLPCR